MKPPDSKLPELANVTEIIEESPTRFEVDGNREVKAEGLTHLVGPGIDSNASTNRDAIAGVDSKAPTNPAKAEPAKPTEHPIPQQPSSRYLIKRFHARGGMGEVWLADDLDIGRVVALKKIRTGVQGLQESFCWEARVTGQLEHPGIVPVHELSRDMQGEPFYVMKYVHGQTLFSAIAEYHKTPAGSQREVSRLRLMQIFLSLCQTIAYAHSRGVIHRDIKPENVMLGEYGETLVLDWGLAKIVGQDERSSLDDLTHISGQSGTAETVAGSVKGTPYYMAPESARGEVKAIDQQSDVFLLGGTLYHILTNRRPRQARTVKELLALAQETPIEPHSYDATIPKPLEAICLKALEIDKADRYASADALADDVERFLAGEPVLAYQENTLERMHRWSRRHGKILSRALVACVFLNLLGFGWWKYHDLQHQQQVEQAKIEKQLEDEKKSREEAEQAAAELAAQNQARLDRTAFHRLAEEARFLAACTDPLSARVPYFDPQAAYSRAQQALAWATSWGPKLEQFVLSDDRPSLAKELAEFEIFTAQIRLDLESTEAAAKEVLHWLDDAERLQPASRSAYRLRAEALRILGQDASRFEKLANDPATRTIALDAFLLGEKARNEPRPRQSQADVWKPDRRALEVAVDHYQQALRLDPEYYWAHLQLGLCYQNLGRSGEALQTLATCIALRPDSPWGYSSRGIVLTLQRRFNEAEADLNRAIQLDSDFRPARLYRGTLAMLRQDFKEAIADFDHVLAPPVENRLIEGAFLKAQLLADQGQLKEALTEIDRVLAEPRHPRSAHLLRAQLRFARNDDVGGLADLDALIGFGQRDYDPHSPQAFAQRGHRLRLIVQTLSVDLRPAKLRLAEEQLKKALDMQPTAAAWNDLGMIHEQLGQRVIALDDYTHALKLEPRAVKILVQRGWLYEKQQPPDLARAEADFLAANQLLGDDAEIHTGLGYIQACRKQESAALRSGQRALLFSSGDPLNLHNVACIHAKLAEAFPDRAKAFEDYALDQLQRAVELWQRDRSGPNLLALIEQEPAFTASLRNRPEFRKLLQDAK